MLDTLTELRLVPSVEGHRCLSVGSELLAYHIVTFRLEGANDFHVAVAWETAPGAWRTILRKQGLSRQESLNYHGVVESQADIRGYRYFDDIAPSQKEQSRKKALAMLEADVIRWIRDGELVLTPEMQDLAAQSDPEKSANEANLIVINVDQRNVRLGTAPFGRPVVELRLTSSQDLPSEGDIVKVTYQAYDGNRLVNVHLVQVTNEMPTYTAQLAG